LLMCSRMLVALIDSASLDCAASDRSVALIREGDRQLVPRQL
jgi:hypothetical protein